MEGECLCGDLFTKVRTEVALSETSVKTDCECSGYVLPSGEVLCDWQGV